MKQCVDRLTVLDGVIIAVGWCEGKAPEIVIDGCAVDQQVCQRFSRPDVNSHLGKKGPETYGFRLAALVADLQDYSGIAVRFQNGQVLVEAPGTPENRIGEVLDRFLGEISNAPADASLIELGSRARSGHDYRSLFPTISDYTGVDLVDGDNVDVVADLHVLSKTVHAQHDFAFSISVFEHLLMPWVAAVELNNVLVEGGLAFIQSHPTWPLHEEPWDYFRFSKEAWHGLFNAHTGFELLDSAYAVDATVIPMSVDNTGVLPRSAVSEAFQGFDKYRTFLLSACLIRKISEPRVNWSCDPSEVYDLEYHY